MNLNELKRNESKLRRRLGDDQYEKIYTAQQRIEALRGKAANKRQGAGGDTDNMFYTNRPDSGTITNIPSIADYRKGIEDISAKIESLNKQQYEHMLSGDNSKVNALDNVIKNAEKQRDALRKQMSLALGIGSESKEKDMLRARGNAGGSLFGAGDNKKATGLDDDKSAPRLKIPGTDTFDDYVNRDDYNNVNDYLDAAAKQAYKYIKDGDKEGFSEFWDRNGLSDNLLLADMVDERIRELGKQYSTQQTIAAPTVGNNILAFAEDGSIIELGSSDWNDRYKTEKKQRSDALKYTPSENFSMLINDSLKSGQKNLDLAKNMDNAEQIAEYEEKVALYESIEEMFTNSNNPNSLKYYKLEAGLQAIESLSKDYQEDLLYARDSAKYQEVKGKLDLVNDEIITINRGMNVVGEAYLDEIDDMYKNHKISPDDYDAAYKDYYQSVIDRESNIEIESRSLNEDNLTINDDLDYNIMGVLESLDVPLYKSEQDAVLAFKKEAMPLTLKNNTEFSAILDDIDILDTETGEVKTYYYYLEVKQGAPRDVIGNAIVGAGGGDDRRLLHTHPVEGYWGRNFSGNPENDGLNKKIFDGRIITPNSFFEEAGDSSVPNWLGYGGIYVINSGAEVKLYEGHGKANIGSGHNTHADTKDEMSYVSTVDLY